MGNFLKSLNPVNLLAGRKKDPMKAAAPYFNQAKAGFQPYATAGQNAMNTSQPLYNRMASDPQSMINEILAGYEMSPGAQYQQDKIGQAMSNTAAAGGYRGTGMEQGQQAEFLQELLGGDMQQWLQNVTGMQGRGLSGLEGATDRGYNAASDIGNIYGQQAGMAAQGANDSNARRAGLAKALGQIVGVGFGGPAAGGQFGKTMGGIFGGGEKDPAKRTQYGQRLGGLAAGDLFGMF